MIVKKTREWHYSRLDKGYGDLPKNYKSYSEDELERRFNVGVSANCHQFSAKEYGDNLKIITKDGYYEAIYDKNSGNMITDPRDIGTYNYAHPDNDPIGHAILDVVPWIIWGNSEQDTTNIFQRVGYMIYGLFV